MGIAGAQVEDQRRAHPCRQSRSRSPTFDRRWPTHGLARLHTTTHRTHLPLFVSPPQPLIFTPQKASCARHFLSVCRSVVCSLQWPRPWSARVPKGFGELCASLACQLSAQLAQAHTQVRHARRDVAASLYLARLAPSSVMRESRWRWHCWP